MNKQITHEQARTAFYDYLNNKACLHSLKDLMLSYFKQQEQKDKALDAEIGGNIDYFWEWTAAVNKLEKVAKELALYKEYFSLADEIENMEIKNGGDYDRVDFILKRLVESKKEIKELENE
ncbi:MAG TPA: hypothetical protein VLZ83_16515 [Edaphocola sp.]|nr:hypothetical protein [Edaphocola sp.]